MRIISLSIKPKAELNWLMIVVGARKIIGILAKPNMVIKRGYSLALSLKMNAIRKIKLLVMSQELR